jgi:low temperature requirement protein LtrA
MKLQTRGLQLRNNRAHKPVSWLELFFDLIFVAAVAQVGEPLAHDFTWPGIFRYSFLFLLIWWAWLGHTMFSTRFESDDTLQRVLTLVQVFAAAVMAANAKEALSSRDAAGFGAAYGLMRAILVVQYLRGRRLKVATKLATSHAIGYGSAALLWFGAALLDTPMRFYIWGIALAIDLATPMFSLHHTHKLPPDSAHIPERHGLFTIILIGESVTSVMRGIESQEGWSTGPATAAILGMCLAFTYWWWYFNHNAEAEKRKVNSTRSGALFHAWSYVHFLLCLGIAVAGIGVSHIIALMHGEPMDRTGSCILLSAASLIMLSLTTTAVTANQSTWSRKQTFGAAYLLCFSPILALPFATTVAPSFILLYLVLLCVAAMRLTAGLGGTREYSASTQVAEAGQLMDV